MMPGVSAQSLRTVLVLVVAVAVLGLVAAWPFVAGAAANPIQRAALHPVMLVGFAGFLASASIGGRYRPLWRVVACAGLLANWCAFRVLTMGDGAVWRVDTANGEVSYAEPLSSLLYAIVHHGASPAAIEWIPPLAGVLATYAWLDATDRLMAKPGTRAVWATRFGAALMWASSGVLVVFHQRYVEHTQLGIAPLLVGLSQLTLYTHARADRRPARGALVLGSAGLALAAVSHLQYSGMLVAGVGATLLLAFRHRDEGFRVAKICALVIGAIVGVVRAVFALSPFETIIGSVMGGADARLLVTADEVFSPPHLAMVAGALTFAVPMALPFGVLMLTAQRRAASTGKDLALVAAGGAYLAFVGLYGFDLGWPRDTDLMISMSPALSLLVAWTLLPRIAERGGARWLLLACLGLSAARHVVGDRSAGAAGVDQSQPAQLFRRDPARRRGSDTRERRPGANPGSDRRFGRAADRGPTGTHVLGRTGRTRASVRR